MFQRFSGVKSSKVYGAVEKHEKLESFKSDQMEWSEIWIPARWYNGSFISMLIVVLATSDVDRLDISGVEVSEYRVRAFPRVEPQMDLRMARRYRSLPL